MFTKKICILLGLMVALATESSADETVHNHTGGHNHTDGHDHDKDVHTHDIAYTDHCFACDHQVYSQTGDVTSPKALEIFKGLSGSNEVCKAPGAATPSTPCKLREKQVCLFQLVDVTIKNKNVSNESYSVRQLSRRCVNDTQGDKRNCTNVDREMIQWVGIALKNLTNSGYESVKTSRVCYCSGNDCNDEVVSAASLTSIQALNIWGLVSLVLGYVLLKPAYCTIRS